MALAFGEENARPQGPLNVPPPSITKEAVELGSDEAVSMLRSLQAMTKPRAGCGQRRSAEDNSPITLGS